MVEPLDTPRPGMSPFKKGTLASIVGLATASLVLVQVPAEESGRTVSARIAPDGVATITHVAGPQYLRVYLDLVGKATACDGLTGAGIAPGKSFTEAQCATMLESRLADTAQHVMACTPGLALTIPNRDNVRGQRSVWPTTWAGRHTAGRPCAARSTRARSRPAAPR
jgi:lysozyme